MSLPNKLRDLACESAPRDWAFGFDLVPADRQGSLNGEAAARASDRPRLCEEFFRSCLQVYEALLRGQLPPQVKMRLFQDLEPFGLDFHRSLGSRALDTPSCFRTDEAGDGSIYEIQAPGSIWGEYLLLLDYYAGVPAGPASESALRTYVEGLRADSAVQDPQVLYLADASSAQAGVRYFIARSMTHGIGYYGWTPSVKVSQIDHVRAHSFHALLAENLYREHLTSARVTYDLPLNGLFDCKVLLPLPFWRWTREFFTEEVRSMFAPSAFLESEGVDLPGEGLVSREEFLDRPPRQRRWYLKYAGGDLSRNWGSRAVYRLKTRGRQWREILEDAWDGACRGEAWILQEERTTRVHQEEEEMGVPADYYAKCSVLCCYGEVFGVIGMYSKSAKTHGQADTIVAPLIR